MNVFICGRDSGEIERVNKHSIVMKSETLSRHDLQGLGFLPARLSWVGQESSMSGIYFSTTRENL